MSAPPSNRAQVPKDTPWPLIACCCIFKCHIIAWHADAADNRIKTTSESKPDLALIHLSTASKSVPALCALLQLLISMSLHCKSLPKNYQVLMRHHAACTLETTAKSNAGMYWSQQRPHPINPTNPCSNSMLPGYHHPA
jgi:hypothetical protein